jgi:transcription elongation factor Elf1
MSIHCKVCNALKIVNLEKPDSKTNWECQNCGSTFDGNDNYVIVD